MKYQYPVEYPEDFERCRAPQKPPFPNKHMKEAIGDLYKELKLAKVLKSELVTNHKLTAIGSSVGSNGKGPAAQLFFRHDGKNLMFLCDKYFRLEDNIYALKRALNHYRMFKNESVFVKQM